jgi:predicted porin
MKKTLVAIAAMASVTAFAQSSVTIDGYIDRGFTTTNNTNDAKDFKGVSSSAGTTTIGIKGVEDLGSGMKVGFSVNTDWNDLGGLTSDGSAIGTASVTFLTASGNVASQTGAFANAQSFLEFSSTTFGTVRLGSPNNDILTTATSIASPAFSTGIGSTYSSSFSTHNGIGTGTTGYGGIPTVTTVGTTGGGARGIRQANTIKYISPNMNGITASYTNAEANSNSGTSTVDTVGVTEASLRYTNGPLDLMYSTLNYKVGSNTAPLVGSLTALTSNRHNLLGASYTVMPGFKLHYGAGSSSASVSTIADTSSIQMGVSYTLGQIDFMAQTAKVNDKSTTNADRKMTGLGANYNLSKTTRVYYRMDDLNLSTITAATGSSIKRSAIGISRSF